MEDKGRGPKGCVQISAIEPLSKLDEGGKPCFVWVPKLVGQSYG